MLNFKNFFVSEGDDSLTTENTPTITLPISDKTNQVLPSSFLQQLRKTAKDNQAPANTVEEVKKENMSPRKLTKEQIAARLAELNTNKQEDKDVAMEVVVENRVKKTETALLSFKDISSKMIEELETFGVTDFSKIISLEQELNSLKDVLNSLQTNQEETISKINSLIQLHEQIISKFDEIKKMSESNDFAKRTSENTELALSDVKSELENLKKERDSVPSNINEQKAKLKEQIEAKTLELRNLHKDATSEQRRKEILKILTVLNKIEKITNATDEIKDITEKLDPEKLEMFLSQLNLQGFMFVLTSKNRVKKKVIDNQKIVNDNDQEEVGSVKNKSWELVE